MLFMLLYCHLRLVRCWCCCTGSCLCDVGGQTQDFTKTFVSSQTANKGPAAGNWRNCHFVTGRIAAKRQPAGIKFIITGQKSAFLPHRGDSLHQFTLNLAQPWGTWVHLVVQHFTPVSEQGWECGPKSCEFPHFGKESFLSGEPFDRFLQ